MQGVNIDLNLALIAEPIFLSFAPFMVLPFQKESKTAFVLDLRQGTMYDFWRMMRQRKKSGHDVYA